MHIQPSKMTLDYSETEILLMHRKHDASVQREHLTYIDIQLMSIRSVI